MKELLNDVIKDISALIPFKYLHRGADFSIVKREFPAAMTARKFPNRKELWDYTIDTFGLSTKSMTYVEFGVWQGESIEYFASRNSNPHSLFVGMDSFEGLPEDWFGFFSKGSFSEHGSIPEVSDERIHFMKGWFYDTWRTAEGLIAGRTSDELLVHFDADVYASTLFALASMDGLKRRYLGIFDEFSGEESRALYNYRQAYGAQIEFLAGAPDTRKYPIRTLCWVVPRLTPPEPR
jgi:hypothetical protein